MTAQVIKVQTSGETMAEIRPYVDPSRYRDKLSLVSSAGMIGHLQTRKRSWCRYACSLERQTLLRPILLTSVGSTEQLELLVSAEPAEKVGLAACPGRRCTGHAATSPTTAHGKTGQDKEDHRSKGEPETFDEERQRMIADRERDQHTWSGDGTETEVIHLILEVGIEGNVDSERDEGQGGSEERDERGDERDRDVLREREQECDKGNTTCYIGQRQDKGNT